MAKWILGKKLARPHNPIESVSFMVKILKLILKTHGEPSHPKSNGHESRSRLDFQLKTIQFQLHRKRAVAFIDLIRSYSTALIVDTTCCLHRHHRCPRHPRSKCPQHAESIVSECNRSGREARRCAPGDCRVGSCRCTCGWRRWTGWKCRTAWAGGRTAWRCSRRSRPRSRCGRRRSASAGCSACCRTGTGSGRRTCRRTPRPDGGAENNKKRNRAAVSFRNSQSYRRPFRGPPDRFYHCNGCFFVQGQRTPTWKYFGSDGKDR